MQAAWSTSVPEGHTLHRLARSVRDAFGGRVVEASSPQGRFAEGDRIVVGAGRDGALTFERAGEAVGAGAA